MSFPVFILFDRKEGRYGPVNCAKLCMFGALSFSYFYGGHLKYSIYNN